MEKPAIKLSHKQWRYVQKRLRRKRRRQAVAVSRTILDKSLASNDIITLTTGQEEEDEAATLAYENERKVQHLLWLERERLAQEEWERKQAKARSDQLKLEEQEKRIKEEWAERQKQEAEEKEKKTALEKTQADLLKKATENERVKDPAGVWRNPAPPEGTERETCPFFAKTGVCRFGTRCSRYHPSCGVTCTLLFPNMYSHYRFDSGAYDEEASLEYEDSELQGHFNEFYYDILLSFREIGTVVQLKVCCNYEPHLRGNVYVQFERDTDANIAYQTFNGRFYAGHRVHCVFTEVVNWKRAICGVFRSNRCPKGKHCNFLHVFRNPGNDFAAADRATSPTELTSRLSLRNSQRSERRRHDKHESSPNIRNNRYSDRGYRSRERDYRSRSRDYRSNEGDYRSRERDDRSGHRDHRSRDRDNRSKERQNRSRSRDHRSNESDYRSREHDDRSENRDYQSNDNDYRSRDRDCRSRSHSNRPKDCAFKSPKSDDRTSKHKFHRSRSRSQSSSSDDSKAPEKRITSSRRKKRQRTSHRSTSSPKNRSPEDSKATDFSSVIDSSSSKKQYIYSPEKCINDRDVAKCSDELEQILREKCLRSAGLLK